MAFLKKADRDDIKSLGLIAFVLYIIGSGPFNIPYLTEFLVTTFVANVLVVVVFVALFVYVEEEFL